MTLTLRTQARQVLGQAMEHDGQCMEAVDGMVQLLIKEAKWDEAIHMYANTQAIRCPSHVNCSGRQAMAC